MSQSALEYNAIVELPKMSWRGLAPPHYDSANISGSFSLAERRYPYIDAASHENVGRNPIPMKFKLYFLNNLAPGNFPGLFQEWLNAVAFDKSVGKLEHPILGMFFAQVKSWSVALSADKTSGVIMTVSFIETVPDPLSDIDVIIDNMGAGNLTALAEAAHADYSKLKLPWPDGVGVTSLLDLAKQIQGLVQQTRSKVEGKLNQALGIVDGLIEAVESVGTNAQWALVGNLVSLWNGIKSSANKAGIETRAIAKFVFNKDKSFDEVSRATGNTVGELMGLNRDLMGSPLIPANTPVKYYTDKKFNAVADDLSLGV